MAPETEFILFHELRLLRCTLPPEPDWASYYAAPHGTSTVLLSTINDTLRRIEAAQYVAALSSDAVRSVFKSIDTFQPFCDCSVESISEFYSVLLRNAVSYAIDEAAADADRSCRVFFLVSIAVASFLAFCQSNITGPKQELPMFPLGAMKVELKAEWEGWARNQLMSSGSDLMGKLSNLQYLVFAKLLLTQLKDALFEASYSSMHGIRSISWWLARIILLHQRISVEQSSSLFDQLQLLFGECLQNFGTFETVTDYWGAKLCKEEAMTIASMLHLEAGIMEHSYGRVDPSRRHFVSSELGIGLQLSVIGALGFRTVHQTEPKAQLVLVANKNSLNNWDASSSISIEHQKNPSTINIDKVCSNRDVKSEASDIFLTPRLLENKSNYEIGATSGQNGSAAFMPSNLNAIQQSIILAQCLFREKSSRHDEMQRWEMAPYIEAIDSQQASYFIIQHFCDILRIRWESSRSRTKERALLMMEKLVQSLHEPLSKVTERIYFCFGVYVPTIPALRKEYGELLVSCGMIGEAVKIFEDLELWDNLIYCYRLLEKKAAALEVIKKRLSEMPSDSRLWCSLGDVTNNDAYYEKALEVSNNRSARALRSLARSAYNREEFTKSKMLWESAMALNSMYPDGWFALGAAALKARDIEKALVGFKHAVQCDPDNGEAWNNIACLYVVRKKSKEAFIAFKEALKFKRESWQLWENYSQVAAETGNFSQAMEAIKLVMDITGNKRIDVNLLDCLMLEIEGRVANTGDNSCASQTSDKSDWNCINGSLSTLEVQSRETSNFIEMLGKILQRVVRSSGDADTWGIYARWHKIKGDLTMCSEALLKQVRSYQGSDLWNDMDRFRKFANASLELCEVYMKISSTSGSRRELVAAEMHLKNIIKQAGVFSQMKEFQNIETCLDEVKVKLQSF